MANSEAAKKMRAHIARVRELRKFANRAAPLVARELRNEVVRSSAKAESPTGSKWRPALEGEPILRNVAGNLTTAVIGTTVLLSLSELYARHHLGATRGGAGKIPRRILPTELSVSTARAIRRVLGGEFEKIMGGG